MTISILHDSHGESAIYAKIFTSLYQGTLRGKAHEILVFTNLLAHADKEGYVDIHPRAISEEVGLPVEQVRAALDALEAPDEESRTPDENGKRIVRMDEHRAWGWRVVNHAKYRNLRNEEERREQNRQAQARTRERKAQESASVSNSQHASARVSKHQQSSAESAHTDTDTDTDTNAEASDQEHVQPAAARATATRFAEFWSEYPMRKGKKVALSKWKQKGLDAIADRIIEDVRRRKAQDRQWLDGFVPHGSTYVSQCGWEDDIDQRGKVHATNQRSHQPCLVERVRAANGLAEQRELERFDFERSIVRDVFAPTLAADG